MAESFCFSYVERSGHAIAEPARPPGLACKAEWARSTLNEIQIVVAAVQCVLQCFLIGPELVVRLTACRVAVQPQFRVRRGHDRVDRSKARRSYRRQTGSID